MQGLPFTLPGLTLSAVINIIILILFCRSLIKTLALIEPENRAVTPLAIWLLLVPVVNKVMNFIVVLGMSKSLSNELKSREFEDVEKPTLSSGLIFSVLAVVFELAIPLALIYVPLLKDHLDIISILGLIQIVFFIQYWMKISWYRNILQKDSENENEQL